MGYTEKLRNGRWKGSYRAPDGRERSKTFDRKIDTEAFVVTMEAEKLRGEWRDPKLGRRLFGDVAKEWQAAQVHDDATAAVVEAALRLHILPTFEHRRFAAIRPSEVQAWVKGRADVLAPSTLRVVYRWLAAIFAAAVHDGVITQSPCRRIKLPEVEKDHVVPLPTKAVLALTEAVPERHRAMVILAAGTGLRQGECFGLPLANWDRRAGQLQVTQQVKYLPGRGRFLAPPKTPASRRTVPIPDVVRKALAAHVLRFPVGESGLVFTAEGGQLHDRNAFNATWRKAVAAVGLPKGTGFHDLRHYYASVLIAGGASVKVVQARLGHKSALETLDTYGHLWPDSDDLTRRAVDAVLGGSSLSKVPGGVGEGVRA